MSLCQHLYSFEEGLPSLIELFSPSVTSSRLEAFLHRMRVECFKPPRQAVCSREEVLSLEALVKERLPPMRATAAMEPMPSAKDQLDWRCKQLASELSKDRGSDAAGVGLVDLGERATGELRAAVSTEEVRAHLDQVRALLDQPSVSSLRVSQKLAGSSITFFHKIALGFPFESKQIPYYGELFKRLQPHVVRWDYNLSLQLAAKSNGTYAKDGERWRIGQAHTLYAKEFPAVAARIEKALSHAADNIRMRRWSNVPWLLLAYVSRGARENTVYQPVPAELEFTHLEHYEVMLDLVGRVELALCLDSEATNSLTMGVRQAKEFFMQHSNAQATRESSIKRIIDYFSRMFATTDKVWETVMSSRDALIAMPLVVIPRESDCLGMFKSTTDDNELVNALVRVAPRMAEAAGFSTSLISLPAGVEAPRATYGAPYTERGRSRSQSPVRAGDGRGTGSGRPTKKLVWLSATDFSYSKNGAVVSPSRCARELGCSRNRCWPVVASLKQRQSERDEFCQTPNDPACINGSAHVQTPEDWSCFEHLSSRGRGKQPASSWGGRGGGLVRDGIDAAIKSNQLERSQSEAREARLRAQRLEREMRSPGCDDSDGRRSHSSRDRRRSPSPRRDQDRSRSPVRRQRGYDRDGGYRPRDRRDDDRYDDDRDGWDDAKRHLHEFRMDM